MLLELTHYSEHMIYFVVPMLADDKDVPGAAALPGAIPAARCPA